MATSRRDFLKKGGLVALAAGVPLSLLSKVSGKEIKARVAAEPLLNKAAFMAQLNTEFRFHHGRTKVPVKLVEVADLVHRKGASPGKEGFALVFSGPRSLAMTQDTYCIEHEKLGSFSLLIVPIGTKDKGRRSYEAVLNRLYP